MRKKKNENFYAELINSKNIIDITSLEKRISNITKHGKQLIENEITAINKLLENRYEKYGIIDEIENVEAFKRGYYDLGKIGLTLNEIRTRIIRLGYEKETPLGIRIQQDWNYIAHLLNDLLYLENINLHNYLALLNEHLEKCKNSDLHSIYSEKQLEGIYNYLCRKKLFCDNTKFREFLKVFKSYGFENFDKIKVNTSQRGNKALLRVAVEVLTKNFPVSLVNRYFADENGNHLNIGCHNRSTAYDDYRKEMLQILS